MTVGQLLTLLLGGGAVATITALFNGWKSIKEGSRTRERDTVSDLITRRNDAEDERDFAIDERDYWRNRAGTLEYTCRRAGLEMPVAETPPVRSEKPVKEKT